LIQDGPNIWRDCHFKFQTNLRLTGKKKSISSYHVVACPKTAATNGKLNVLVVFAWLPVDCQQSPHTLMKSPQSIALMFGYHHSATKDEDTFLANI
jgi:hypothetical protein